MFASGSKTKNVVMKSAAAATTATTKSPHSIRSARLSSSAAAAASNSARNAASANVQARSKFTEHKQMPPLRTRSLRLDQPASVRSNPPVNAGNSSRTTPTSFAGKKNVTAGAIPTGVSGATATASAVRARVWNRKESKLIVETKTTKIVEQEQSHLAELGIQTNEPEILNHELLVGDIKLLLPSKAVAAEIDRQREEARKKSLLKAHRKFEEHAEKEEEHLTDLKEFLEKAAVTKRHRKPKLSLELDKKLIHSMDEMLNKEVPKAESMTDIKDRIKKKEQELLNLFDTVENMQIYSNTN